MYNGIGLQTPRGSGTNGHVQRNWALVRKTKDKVNYRTEEEIAKLDSASNKQPNKEILDHERKRKIEVKCAELEESLEQSGLSREEVQRRVIQYREKLQVPGPGDVPRDEFGRPAVTESHAVAEAQREKNARLRNAFGISDEFVDGSSLDPARRRERAERERAERAERLERERAERIDREKTEREREERGQYELVRTPSHERSDTADYRAAPPRKKKKHSVSPEPKSEKKKKSKKNRKEKDEPSKKKKKKRSKSSDSSSSDSSSDTCTESSESDKPKRKRKKKRISKKKAQSDDDSSDIESPPPKPAKRQKNTSEDISQTEHKSKKSSRQQRDDLSENKNKGASEKVNRSKRADRSLSNSEDRRHHKLNNTPQRKRVRSPHARDNSGTRRTPSETPDRQRNNRSRSPRERKRTSSRHIPEVRQRRSDYNSAHDNSEEDKRRRNNYNDLSSRANRRDKYDSSPSRMPSRVDYRNGSSPSRDRRRQNSPTSKERHRIDSPPPKDNRRVNSPPSKRRNLDDADYDNRSDRQRARKDDHYDSPEPRYYSGNFKDESRDRAKVSPRRYARNHSPAERKYKDTKVASSHRETCKDTVTNSVSKRASEKLDHKSNRKDKQDDSSHSKPRGSDSVTSARKSNNYTKSSSRDLTPELIVKKSLNKKESKKIECSSSTDKSKISSSNKASKPEKSRRTPVSPHSRKTYNSSPFAADCKLSPDGNPVSKNHKLNESAHGEPKNIENIQKRNISSVDRSKSNNKGIETKSPDIPEDELAEKRSELSEVPASTTHKSTARTRKLSTPISVRENIQTDDKSSVNHNTDRCIYSKSHSRSKSPSIHNPKSISKPEDNSRSRSRSNKSLRTDSKLGRSSRSRSGSHKSFDSKTRSHRSVRSRSESRKSYRSRSREKVKSHSPSLESANGEQSRSPKIVKSQSKSRSHSRRSNSSSLSYSPARRSPERYREIIEKLPEKDKSKYIKSPSALEPRRKSDDNIKLLIPLPVVRLRSSSSENDDDDDLPRMYEPELQEDLMFKKLAELAAKTKESIEKKKSEGNQTQDGTSQSVSIGGAQLNTLNLIEDKPDDDVAIGVTESSKPSSPTGSDANVQEKGNRTGSRSRSRSASSAHSRRSRSRSRSRSHSRSSSSSTSSRRSRSSRSSSSYSRSSSRSRSSRSTNSSGSSRSSRAHSRTGSRSRSPSIPRRAGSPSFLDRRRITRKKYRRSSSRSEDSSSSSSSD